MDKLLKAYWKVPFRQVYCETLRQCIGETIYCHIVLRINPPNLPIIS